MTGVETGCAEAARNLRATVYGVCHAASILPAEASKGQCPLSAQAGSRQGQCVQQCVAAGPLARGHGVASLPRGLLSVQFS